MFQMLHVHNPFTGKVPIYPLDIAVYMVNIAVRHILECFPRLKFFNQMKDRLLIVKMYGLRFLDYFGMMPRCSHWSE